jgi:Methyltransferase domain
MPDSANEHLPQLKTLLEKLRPQRILDVGMGRGSYGWWLRNEARFIGHLTGIEIWAPYVEGPDAIAGGNRGYYDVIHVGDIRHSLDYVNELKPDLIFAFDVLEHLKEDDAVKVLRALQRASRQGVLVSCPNIPYPQGEHYGNPHEAHLRDCWYTEEMGALGSEIIHEGACTALWHFPGGLVDRKVSVVLNTARSDDSFRGLPILGSILGDLEKQTFRDFEFIIVDGLHHDRHRDLIGHPYPFRVLHVPPKQTVMVKDGRCSICAYKNTGFAHARGELIITIDDGCKLDEGFIARVVEEWDERGNMLNAMYEGIHDDGTPMERIGAIDSRGIYLGQDGRCVGKPGDYQRPPMYGFASFPLEAVLTVNGYDEMYDGARGLEDCDMGWRLQRAGYRIALDVRHKVRLYQQGAWSTKVFGENICGKGYDDTAIHCNEQTIRLRHAEIDKGMVRANSVPWGPDKWNHVAPRCYLLDEAGKGCTLYNSNPCPYVGKCSDREHASLKLLRDNPPVFDLRELRHNNGITEERKVTHGSPVPPEQPTRPELPGNRRLGGAVRSARKSRYGG